MFERWPRAFRDSRAHIRERRALQRHQLARSDTLWLSALSLPSNQRKVRALPHRRSVHAREE